MQILIVTPEAARWTAFGEGLSKRPEPIAMIEFCCW